MTIQTSTQTATLPRVNLLPPEIEERKRLQQVQAGLVLAVVAAVTAVVALDMGGSHQVKQATQDLAAATSQHATLARQVATYRDVNSVAGALAATQATFGQATATEIRWSQFLSDFSEVLPTTTWVTSMNLAEQTPAGTLASPNDASGTIGTVTLNGVAMAYGDLAKWLDSLQSVTGLSNIYFSTATEQYIGATKTVAFTGTAQVSPNALCATAGSC